MKTSKLINNWTEFNYVEKLLSLIHISEPTRPLF